MKFSLASAALFACAVVAVPLHEHGHHLHRRALVTDIVYQTRVHYQKEVVYVDQNGDPVSTAFEIVQTSTLAPSTSLGDAGQDNAPATTSVEAAQPTTTDDTIQGESTGDLIDTASPSTTDAPTVAAPAPTTTSTEAPAPTTTEAAPTTEDPTPSSSSAPAPSSTGGSSSGGGSGQFSGDGTFYNAGLGACGITSSDSEYIVAISEDLFDSEATPNPNNNPFCGRKITAYRNGKSVQVTVVDRCTGCSYDSLDFSPAAFNELADPAEGRVKITWNWD